MFHDKEQYEVFEFNFCSRCSKSRGRCRTKETIDICNSLKIMSGFPYSDLIEFDGCGYACKNFQCGDDSVMRNYNVLIKSLMSE